MSLDRTMDDPEHLAYHREVGLNGCGVPGCDFGTALALHFKAIAMGKVEGLHMVDPLPEPLPPEEQDPF